MPVSQDPQDIEFLARLQIAGGQSQHRTSASNQDENATAHPAMLQAQAVASLNQPPQQPGNQPIPGLPAGYSSMGAMPGFPTAGLLPWSPPTVEAAAQPPPGQHQDFSLFTAQLASLGEAMTAIAARLDAQQATQDAQQVLIQRLLGAPPGPLPAQPGPQPAPVGSQLLPPPQHAPPVTLQQAATTTTAFPTVPPPPFPTGVLPGLLPAARQPEVCLPNRCRIPARVASQAQAGEYVNLLDFLPAPVGPASGDVQLVSEDGVMAFKSVRAGKKSIDSFGTWLTAWDNYMALMAQQNPALYPAMLAHQRRIQDADARFNWPAVYAFDCEFRNTLAATQSLAFDTFNANLYTVRLDAAAVKPAAKCYRCESTEHMARECPFRQVAAMEKAAATKKGAAPSAPSLQGNRQPSKQGKRAAQPQWYHGALEGCNNYQTNRCKLSPCPRAHVCQGCRGPLPFSICTTCRAGASATPAQSRPVRQTPQ